MRKEILIAVFAGIIVGLVVAFGAWRANSAFRLKQQGSPQSQNQNTVQKTSQKKEEKLELSLLNLEDFDVLTETPVKVSGITKPESIVVISGENEDYALKSDKNGSFEQNVELQGGVNQILFSVLEGGGETLEKKVIIVYSSEFTKSP